MRGLLASCRTTAPTEIELSALAALLHSFYTGVENSFDLDWQKMSPLVLRLEETFKMLEEALNDFLKSSA